MKIVKNLFKGLGYLLLVVALVYLLGPNPTSPVLNRDLPVLTDDLEVLEKQVLASESADSILPGNEAEIVWADPTKKEKTAISVVYLHGFTASKFEGDPVHREFAKRYGCNLYLPRLAGHGVKTDNPMVSFTPENIVASAKHALAVAKKLGDEVILITCSTGGTLGIYLAGGDSTIKGLINYSPNIAMARGDSYFLNKPWGLQIARSVFGGDFYSYEDSEENQQYWYTRYRIEALVQLQELLEATMYDDNYEQIHQPFFMGYYYKDEQNQDEVVSVAAMKEMYKAIATPDHLKREAAFPDAGAHVICSPNKSKSVDLVKQETFKFAEEILGLKPIALSGI